MREAMRVATHFEQWCCAHVDFSELGEPWPYFLEDRFGKECLSVLLANGLSHFDDHYCHRIAARLRLKLR